MAAAPYKYGIKDIRICIVAQRANKIRLAVVQTAQEQETDFCQSYKNANSLVFPLAKSKKYAMINSSFGNVTDNVSEFVTYG